MKIIVNKPIKKIAIYQYSSASYYELGIQNEVQVTHYMEFV